MNAVALRIQRATSLTTVWGGFPIQLVRDGKEHSVDYDRTNHAQDPLLGRAPTVALHDGLTIHSNKYEHFQDILLQPPAKRCLWRGRVI
jgi:hypothetical protein